MNPLSSFGSYYTRISKLPLLSSTTSNTITTTVPALLYPLPSILYLLFLSHSLHWHFTVFGPYHQRLVSSPFHDGLIYIFLRGLYVILELVADTFQTTKLKAITLTHLFLVFLSLYFFFSSDFRSRRWETTSWWSQHQSCQSAPRLLHLSQCELLHYEPLIHHYGHCFIRYYTSITHLNTIRIAQNIDNLFLVVFFPPQIMLKSFMKTTSWIS